MQMTDKEIELKLEIIYQKTLRLDLTNYLDWKDNSKMLLEIIQDDVLELYKYFLTKPNTTNALKFDSLTTKGEDKWQTKAWTFLQKKIC